MTILHDLALFRALVLFAAVILIITATQRRRAHPFIAILAAASAFAWAAGLRIPVIGRVFGVGFVAMVYMPGLVIVAAALVANLAARTGALSWLMRMVEGSPRPRRNWLTAGLGLLSGLGASPSAAFALVSPLLQPLGGKTQATRRSATVALTLALSASHGLAPLSPVTIAAVTIIGADWHRTALFGPLLALLLAAFAAVFARRSPAAASETDAPDQQPVPLQDPVAARPSGGAAIALLLAAVIPLLMLMVQSLADIPSEPLGGYPGLEFLVAIGQPLMLVLVAVGIVIVGAPRQSVALLGDARWTGGVLADVSVIVLIVCAAGSFQALCAETGMAQAFGERLLGWQTGTQLGLLLPFVIAAVIKVLQGSSLVAAITAAGMVQPLLAPLGLAGGNGKVLAALAVGIGAMTCSHLNDGYFWLATTTAGMPPLRGVATISLGTLLQGVIALAVLLLAALLLSHG